MSAPGDATSIAGVTARLDALGIAYRVHEHPPVFTVEQAVREWSGIEALHCKNLFLRNKKGTRHYLVVAEHVTTVDIARLTRTLGEDRLSFASADRLQRCLGLAAGSVSPFGLVNDAHREVTVVVEGRLRGAAQVGFHPNVNTATLVLSGADFGRFLAASGNDVRFIDEF